MRKILFIGLISTLLGCSYSESKLSTISEGDTLYITYSTTSSYITDTLERLIIPQGAFDSEGDFVQLEETVWLRPCNQLMSNVKVLDQAIGFNASKSVLTDACTLRVYVPSPLKIRYDISEFTVHKIDNLQSTSVKFKYEDCDATNWSSLFVESRDSIVSLDETLWYLDVQITDLEAYYVLTYTH